MKRLDASHHHPNARAGAAVAVMLAQVQDEGAARYLTIERGAWVEAMVPVDLEAEETQIEFVRLGECRKSARPE